MQKLGQYLGLLMMGLLSLAACNEDDPAETAAPGSAAQVTVPETSEFFLKLSRSWDIGNDTTSETDVSPDGTSVCEVPKGTSAGSSGSTVSCTYTLAEGTMYFSTLHFTFGIRDASTCQFITFQPYFYKASTSATFQPQWVPNTTVNCSGIDTTGQAISVPTTCFSGAGISMITDYPAHTNLVIKGEQGNGMAGLAATSAYKNSRVSNRWIANNLATASRSTNITDLSPYGNGGGDGYVGSVDTNRMRDWSIACRDDHYDPLYIINIKFVAEPVKTSGAPPAACTNYGDWTALSACP